MPEGLGGRQFNWEMVPGSRSEGTAGGRVKEEEPVRGAPGGHLGLIPLGPLEVL